MTTNNNFPFYFAYVDPGTPWSSSLKRGDENIFAIKFGQQEGECFRLSITVVNPRVGLNSTGRKQWAWLAYNLSGTTIPIAICRLVSVPQELQGEKTQLDFIAMPTDMLIQKQALAPSLMVAPYWDDAWLSPEQRLNVDLIPDAYSALWYVKPDTLVVSLEDLLVGSAGEIDFTSDMVLYKTLQARIDKPPLLSVYINSTVNWTQIATGILALSSMPNTIVSYAGDSIYNSWPKPYTNLGSGWSVAYSYVYDNYRTSIADSVTISTSWKNTAKSHNVGDTMSVNISHTFPGLLGPYWRAVVTQSSKFAVIDPAPGGYNDPTAWNKYTDVWVPQWNITVYMSLRYDARRDWSENVRMTLQADLQPVFTDPGGVAANFAQDSELLSLTGSVGIEGPYGTFRGAWAPNTAYSKYDYFMVTVSGEQLAYTVLKDHVSLAAFDQRTTATAWVAGTFYNVGDTVQSGGVNYAVLVTHIAAASFNAAELNSVGQLIYEERANPFSGSPLYQFLSGFRGNWVAGAIYVPNDIFIGPDSNYYKTVIGHTSASPFSMFAYDPTGKLLLGKLLNPPPIGDVTRDSYFASDRGQQSLQYLLMLARAKIINRSRCYRVEFDIRGTDALNLGVSLQKNGRVYDGRLPGGQAFGKIVDFQYSQSRRQGLKCRITLLCTPGNGTAIVPAVGDPEYCDASYCGSDYQRYVNTATAVGAGDVTYGTPIAGSDVGDGLVFPLTEDQVVISETVNTLGSDVPLAVLEAYVTFQRQEQILVDQANNLPVLPWTIWQTQAAQVEATAKALAGAPTWYELVLAPLDTGPFSRLYEIDTSILSLPKQIDLASLL